MGFGRRWGALERLRASSRARGRGPATSDHPTGGQVTSSYLLPFYPHKICPPKIMVLVISYLLPFTFFFFFYLSPNLATKNYVFVLWKFGHLLPLLTSYLLPSYLSPNLVLKKNCVFVLWKFCHLVTGEQDTSHLCNELNFVFNPNFVTDLILYFLGEIWPPSQKLKFGQQNNNALVTWKVDIGQVNCHLFWEAFWHLTSDL